MTKEEIYDRLNEVFKTVFDDDSIIVHEYTSADSIDGWDSLEHINLMVAVENEFGIKFNMGEVTTMENVGDMVNIIMSKL